MPDEIVTIRVDFEANRRDMAQVLAELRGFGEAADAASESTDRVNESTRRFSRTARSADEPLGAMKKKYEDLEQSGKRFGKNLTNGDKLMGLFKKSARLLFFQLIALVGEFVITAATLASVNLLFKLGQWAVKGYNLALGVAGAALATVAVAASTAVAAFREFNAAAAAWQYKGANVYGSATGAAAASMRGLYTDTNLATMGVANLTAAYKAMSQQGKVTGAQTKALSGAMDFTARSEDANKSFQAMANFVAILQKEGKVTAKASTAASGVSKEFADAIKKSKGKDSASIMASMSSGALAKQAGVSGEFGSIKGTLVSQFKQITVALASDMADFGDQFLNDTRVVLDGLFKNVRNMFARLAPEFSSFGKGKLFPAITTIGNALEKFSVTLVRKYLPMLFGASEWFKKTSASFMKSFNQFKNSLEKFREGSRIITETFKGPIFAIFKVFGRNAESLGYLAQDNEEQFTAWGDALEKLIFAIGDWFAALKVAFTEALPVLTAIVNVLSSLISGMAKVVSGIGTFKLGGGEGFMGLGGSGGGPSGTVGGGLGGGVGSLVTLGLLFGGLKGRRSAMRNARYGNTVSAYMNQASKRGAQSVKTGMFGGIPAMFSRGRYDMSDGGRNARLTPAEVAANRAYAETMNASGRSFHDPFMRTAADGTLVRGAEMMGTGNDKIAFDRDGRGFERIGFSNINQYGAYMTTAGPSGVGDSFQGQRLTATLRDRETALRADPGFIAANAKKQAQMLTRMRTDAYAEDMRTSNLGRDLRLGRTAGGGMSGGLRDFFFGGQATAVSPDGIQTATSARRGIFGTLKDVRGDLKSVTDARAASAAFPGVVGMPGPSAMAVAREKAFKEFLKNDTQRKFTNADGTLKDGSKAQRAAERAFARQEMKGRTGAMFKGVGESAQASMRKSFNPMMGMMGGMIASSGITNKIKDKELRGATNNALQYGAMFGTRGMGIAAGVTLMKSTSSVKAGLGGALAGAAVGKTIADTLGPVFGPAGPVAKSLIIGGAALVGGVIGVFKAQGNREKEAKKIGAGIGKKMLGQVGMAVVGATVDPITGRLVQGKGRSYQRGLNYLNAQRKTVAGMDLKGFEAIRSKAGGGGSIQEYQVLQGLNARREKIMRSMVETGMMSGAEQKKMQEYLDQAKDGNLGAMKSFDSMITGFRQTVLGGGTTMKSAEDYMARTGGTADRGGGRVVRGGLFIGKDEEIGEATAMDIVLKRADFVTSRLSKVFGMTEDEIMNLAAKLDVDLGDPMKSMTQIVGELGKVTRKTAKEMGQAIRDIGIASLSVFDDEIKKRATIQAFTASKEKLLGLGNSAGVDDFADYFRQLVLSTQAANPDDPFAVLEATKNFAEGNLGMDGSMANFGLNSSFAKNGKAQAEEAYGKQLSGISQLGMQQIAGGMLEQGRVFKNVGAYDALEGELRKIFDSSIFESQSKKDLMNFLGTGQLIDPKSKKLNLEKLKSLGGAGSALAEVLAGKSSDPRATGGKDISGASLFDTETSKIMEIAGEVELGKKTLEALENANAIIKADVSGEGIGDGSKTPQWFTDMQKYTWQASGSTLKLVQGDTGTPRRGRFGDTSTSRALNRTMAAHGRFNSMLTGKREVTSALRMDNLGSLSSDHAAGRAYDLTGQNLGQYQQMVTKAGGFAEFHGWASSRHLHVVPPIGGTNTSRQGYGGGGGGGMNQNVTLNVYGAPGQSESAIARHVMEALEQQQRAYRERA